LISKADSGVLKHLSSLVDAQLTSWADTDTTFVIVQRTSPMQTMVASIEFPRHPQEAIHEPQHISRKARAHSAPFADELRGKPDAPSGTSNIHE
jgi:hypothetical protein